MDRYWVEVYDDHGAVIDRFACRDPMEGLRALVFPHETTFDYRSATCWHSSPSKFVMAEWELEIK